jgi:predicted ATPase
VTPLVLVAQAEPDGPLVRLLTDPYGALGRGLDAAGEVLASLAPLGVGVGVAAAAAVPVSIAVRARRRAVLAEGARVVTVLAPPEVDPAGGEALWRNLHDLLRPRWRRLLSGQPHLGFEYAWTVEGLSLRVWVPGVVPPGLVERAVESAWPAARTETTPAEENPPLPKDCAVAGGRLRLALPGCYPLRTDHDADPLRALLGAAAPSREGEAAVVQVLARPASYRAVARCRKAAREIRAGRPPRRLARLLDLVTPGPTRRPSPDPAVAAEVRAVLDKASSPLWSVSVQFAVADAKGREGALRGRAHALAASFALHAGRNRLVRRRLRRVVSAVAARRPGRFDLLSTPELAGLAHVPLDRIVPALERAGARAVPPPPAIPRVAKEGKVLGDADAGGARPIVLRPEDARYHLHVMGATGSGKSTLLTNLILGDVEAGRGAVVIDPKGDLVTDVLARLDRKRLNGPLCVLDPQSEDDPPTLNVLEKGVVANDLVVDHLVGILGRIFEHCWGPRLEDVLRSASLTLLHGEGQATLSDVPLILTEKGRWQKYLDAKANPELAGFWHWYEALGDGQRAQVVGPLLYKLRAFLLRPFVRKVVNAHESSIDVAEVLDGGGLLLVRVPKGVLGEDTSRLLGSFAVAKVWQAATARSSLPEGERADAAAYVDECQNFVTTLPRSFDEVLAEARGYRVSFALSHQHLGQLPRDLRDSVSANARNKVFFNVSPEDAFVLARHTSPRLTDHDLSNLGAYQAAVRLVANAQDQPAFTMKTRPARTVAEPEPAETTGGNQG